jgi:hypothetical protein
MTVPICGFGKILCRASNYLSGCIKCLSEFCDLLTFFNEIRYRTGILLFICMLFKKSYYFFIWFYSIATLIIWMLGCLSDAYSKFFFLFECLVWVSCLVEIQGKD